MASSSTPTPPIDKLYSYQEIVFSGEKRFIVVLSVTSSSPFIAICNILLLQKRLTPPPATIFGHVGEKDLINAVASLCTGLSRVQVVEMLERLASMMSLDIKFRSITDYVAFPELKIFAMLGIKLCHGCLVDPQDEEIALLVRDFPFTEIVHRTVTLNSFGDELSLKEGELLMKFLDKTKSQLTKHGLGELRKQLNDNELWVFYRDELFKTLYKFEGKLYILATNHMFVSDSNLVWEKLEDPSVFFPNYVTHDFKDVKIELNDEEDEEEENDEEDEEEENGVESGDKPMEGHLIKGKKQEGSGGDQVGVVVENQEGTGGGHQLGVLVENQEDGAEPLRHRINELSETVKELKDMQQVMKKREMWVLGAAVLIGSFEMARRLRKMFK